MLGSKKCRGPVVTHSPLRRGRASAPIGIGVLPPWGLGPLSSAAKKWLPGRCADRRAARTVFSIRIQVLLSPLQPGPRARHTDRGFWRYHYAYLLRRPGALLAEVHGVVSFSQSTPTPPCHFPYIRTGASVIPSVAFPPPICQTRPPVAGSNFRECKQGEVRHSGFLRTSTV